MNREVALVTADWCPTCKAMEAWFDDVGIPGVTFRVEEVGWYQINGINLSTVPTIFFIADGETIQTVSGGMDKHSLIHAILSLWPELKD